MSKKSLYLLIAILLLVPPGFAIAGFPSDVSILDKQEVVKLSNDQLTDAYMDTMVEIEADRSFHTTSGFSAKEFKNYKNLLKYRMVLLMEIQNRNLKLPQF